MRREPSAPWEGRRDPVRRTPHHVSDTPRFPHLVPRSSEVSTNAAAALRFSHQDQPYADGQKGASLQVRRMCQRKCQVPRGGARTE